MSTDDYLPPHEARSSLGQLGDAGGGRSPMVAATPVPNALLGSPGIATGAASPPIAVGADDPGSLGIAIAQLANALFSGTSVMPAPSLAQAMTTSNTTQPGGPGLAPSVMPAITDAGISPQLSSDGQGDGVSGISVPASVGAAPTPPASVGGAPSAPSFDGVPFEAPLSFGNLLAPGGAALPSASSVPGASSIPGSASLPQSGAFLPTQAPTAPTSASGVPGASSASDQSTPPAGLSRSFAGTESRGGATPPHRKGGLGAPGLGPDGQVPAGPFGSSSFALPSFDDHSFSLPLSDHEPSDAPYYVPAAESPSIESISVRDLGGKPFDPYAVRKDFPILEERVHGKRLVWLDNGATTQKPQAVIDRLAHFYAHENSNIHRAAHTLAARATDAYEQARETVRRFINAPSAQDIIFVRGATEGINLIANTWGRKHLVAGDEIVLTNLEHHANIVPWQMLCAQTGAKLKVAPVDSRGDIILEAYERLLGPRTKLVTFTQVSNALGTITPAREMIAMARRHGAATMLDGAQAVSHMRVDVQQLDCDFYVFSGHKVFAPTGIGAVYGKRDLLAAMPPWQGGGNMIADVTFEQTRYQPPPFRFEAGTGNIADAVGLGAALDYVMRIGIDVIDRYEHDLLGYATGRLAEVPGLTMIGTSAHKAGVMSFVLDGQRTEDVGGALDKDGIAVRSGHHCAQPILRRFGVEATVRASLAFYNVCEDIDALVDALKRLQARGSRP